VGGSSSKQVGRVVCCVPGCFGPPSGLSSLAAAAVPAAAAAAAVAAVTPLPPLTFMSLMCAVTVSRSRQGWVSVNFMISKPCVCVVGGE
jgi:hypothetical protein